MSYKLRQASEPERKFIIDIFTKYIEFRNSRQLTVIFSFPDYKFYEESRYMYYFNLFAEGLIGYDGKPREKMGVCYRISKASLYNWLIENNIIRPKFPKAKLIK
jgi:hypothetical protein